MINQFDEIVVGTCGGSYDFMSKMEEEYNKIKEEELQEEAKPLDQRIKSKNWKTRKNAYSEIATKLSSAESGEDQIFSEFIPFYTSVLDDPHATALEAALDMIRVLFEKYNDAGSLVPNIFQQVLEKCYTSSRQNLKNKAKEILELALEVSNDSKLICESLKSSLENKNPKIQQAACNILTLLIKVFGSFKIDYRPLIPLIEKLTESSSPTMRNEAIEFYRELYKWVKSNIKLYVNKLKDAVQKDLEKIFSDYDSDKKVNGDPPQPRKFLKSDKERGTAKICNQEQINSKILQLKEEENYFKQTEAVELFQGKFNESWTEELLGKSKKWSEKKEMLESFISSSNVLKIANSSRSHIIQAFLTLLKDNNINVITCTIQAIANIAKGLRKEFSEARDFVIPLIELFKEKKEKTVNDLMTCLEVMMSYSLSIEDIIDDLGKFLTSEKEKQIPVQTKEKCCVFLEKTILQTHFPVLKKICKPLSELLLKLIDDANSDVRNASMKTLGVIKYRVGEMAISSVLNQIPDIKLKKIDECACGVVVDPIYEKENSLVGVVNNAISSSSSSNQINQKKKKEGELIIIEPVNENRNVKLPGFMKKENFHLNCTSANINTDVEMKDLSKTEATLSSTRIPPIKKSGDIPNALDNNNNNNNNIDEEDNISDQDIDALLQEKLGAENLSMFNDSKWENRKNAFINLSMYISNNSDDANSILEYILKFIKLKLKNYKENNVNIFKEALVAIQNLCETCGNFSKKNSGILIKRLCEKIGDNKLKQGIGSLFLKFMEYHTPKYIVGILIKQLEGKPPGVLKEGALLFERSIEEFGINLFPVKEMVELSKKLAGNSNPQVRNSATSLLCVMYKYLGAPIKKFLTDIKEATLKVIEDEFEKVTVETSVSCKRELKGEAVNECKSSLNLIDNLFPRMDISKKVTPKIIKDIAEGKWQQKKEALDALEKIFSEANMRILPNGLSDMVTSLKNKLSDGNKNMVRLLIQLISKFVEALGPGSKTYAKILLPPILNNLSDKMNLLREDVVKCLEKWGEMIGFDNVLINFPQYLVIDNFELRADLLKLILKYKGILPKYEAIKELIPGVINCLIDKAPGIRTLSEEVAKEILKFVNINNFYFYLKDYKPAIGNTIKGIIEKYSSLICIGPADDGNKVINVKVNQNVVQQPGNNEQFKQPQGNRQMQANNRRNNSNNSNNNKKRENSSSESRKIYGKSVNPPSSTSAMPNLKPVQVLPTDNQTSTSTQPLHINQSSPSPSNIFIPGKIKMNQKQKRIQSEKTRTFPNEFITQDYDKTLKETMENYIQKNYIDHAYSGDVTKFNSLFSNIANSIKNDPFLFVEVSDLFLKWILIRNIEMNNNLFFNNIILDFYQNLCDFCKESECMLSDIEGKMIVEVLISKFFTLNAQTKSKVKQMSIEYYVNSLIKFDVFLEIISDKMLSSTSSAEIKEEIVEVLKMQSKQPGCVISNKSLYSLLIAMVRRNIIHNEKLKSSVVEIVNNVYMNDSEKEVINKILRENGKGIPELEVLYSKVNQNTTPTATQILPETKNLLPANLSKSPLIGVMSKLKREESSSDDSMMVKLTDNIDQKKLNSMIQSLYNGDTNEKIKVLLDFNDLLTNKFNENVIILEKNINIIFKAFSDLLKYIFSQQKTVIQLEHLDLLRYLLTSFYKLSLAKEVQDTCDVETIYNMYEQILVSILYEGLESLGEQEEGKKVIKSLNALILKLMENVNTTCTFIALIKLIQNYRNDSSRLCSLSIKCLLKLSNIMPSIIAQIEIEKLLYAIFEFLYEFEKISPELTPTTQNEDMSLKILRTIIHEIIKIKNEGIWNYYKVAIERNNLPDKYLKRWIQLILRSKNGISLPPSGGNKSNAGANQISISPMTNLGIKCYLGPNSNLPSTDIHTNSPENELKFYIDRLINSTDKEKTLSEIVAILKRNKFQVECLADKLNEVDYNLLLKVYHSLEEKVPQSIPEDQGRGISPFITDKENINIDSNKDESKCTNVNMKAIISPNVSNSTTNLNTGNASVQIKSLQDYRNKFYGISGKDIKSDKKNTSISPIKNVQHNELNSCDFGIPLEGRKQIYENFLKNKEIVKIKRDLSSDSLSTVGTFIFGGSVSSNGIPATQNSNDPQSQETNNQITDRLTEMKRKLQFLRSQKY